MPERRIAGVYALRSALVSVVAILRLVLGDMIGSAAFAEIIFARPGLVPAPRRIPVPPHARGRPHGRGGAVRGEAADTTRERLLGIPDRLELPEGILGRCPHQLRGGQARRAAVARALLIEPRIVVADELTAGLDMSVRGDLLDLLQDLRERDGVTLVVVSHDLAVIRMTADEVAAMRHGQVAGTGEAARVFAPGHSYTRELLGTWPGVAKRANGAARLRCVRAQARTPCAPEPRSATGRSAARGRGGVPRLFLTRRSSSSGGARHGDAPSRPDVPVASTAPACDVARSRAKPSP